MWDNRCLMHRAIANDEIGYQRRVLNRCVVKGAVPYVGAIGAFVQTEGEFSFRLWRDGPGSTCETCHACKRCRIEQ
jgi:hypothetical protein